MISRLFAEQLLTMSWPTFKSTLPVLKRYDSWSCLASARHYLSYWGQNVAQPLPKCGGSDERLDSSWLFGVSVASRYMNSYLAWRIAVEKYRCKLASVFTKLLHCTRGSSTASRDWQAVPESFQYLKSLKVAAYWRWKPTFSHLAGCARRFSLPARILSFLVWNEKSKYLLQRFCLVCAVRDTIPAFLLLPIVFSCYNGRCMRGFAGNQNCLSKLSFADYLFKAGLVSIKNAENGVQQC